MFENIIDMYPIMCQFMKEEEERRCISAGLIPNTKASTEVLVAKVMQIATNIFFV